MAKRAAAHLTVSALIAEASDFSRDAWRACWLPILLVTAGHTLQFLHGHVSPADWRPGVFGMLAYGLMIFYVPLYGGLYRIAVGGRPAAGRGFGGLQWNGVEWRLIAVGVVVAFLIGLSLVPFLALMGVLALVFRSHPVVSLGPLGDFSYAAVATLPVWLLFIWLMAPRIARLMMGGVYSTAREKTEPFGGWEPAKRSGWPIAWVLALAWIPLLLGYLTVYALTLIEGDALLPNAWPLPEALGAGILLGALRSAVVAPLLVGAVSGAFWLLQEHEDADAANAGSPHPPPMPHEETYPPGDTFPHDEAAAAAAALAAQQAAEAEPPAPDIDHSLIEPPATHGPEATVALAPEHATPEQGTPELSLPQHLGPEDPAPEHPAPAPEHDHHHHEGLAHALEEAAAAAAIAGAAALAAHEAHEAHQAAEAAHDTETAPPLFEPPPAAVETPSTSGAAMGDAEPLSPWPHSVLPPWPVRDSPVTVAAPPAKTGVVESPEVAATEPVPALAHKAEPAHRFVEITELG